MLSNNALADITLCFTCIMQTNLSGYHNTLYHIMSCVINHYIKWKFMSYREIVIKGSGRKEDIIK